MPAAPDEAVPLSPATFRCDLPLGSGADTVWWDLLGSKSETVLAIERIGRSHGLELSDPDCGPEVASGMGEWRVGVTFSGTRVCWADEAGRGSPGPTRTSRSSRGRSGATATWEGLDAWWGDIHPFLNTR